VKQYRLGVLLAVMVGLLAFRLFDLRSSGTSVSEAVDRASRPSSIGVPLATSSLGAVSPLDEAIDHTGADRGDDGVPVRNAFAVRPPIVAVAAPLKQAEQPKPFVGPPVPPPPPPPPPPAPPPFTVIGSWRDEGAAGVFLAGPRGVLVAHVGDVLLAEYTVTRIAPTQLVLKQLNSNREIALPVPVAAASPLASPAVSLSTSPQ
jgi:hypothetical protein